MPGIFAWSATPSSNTVIDGINVAENCPASGINNAIRSVAAIVRQSFSSGLENFLAGTSPLALSSGGTGLSAALTTNALVKQGASAFAQSIISDDGTTATVTGNLGVTGALGVGTTSPTAAAEIRGTFPTGAIESKVTNTSTGASALSRQTLGTGTANSYVYITVADGTSRTIANGSALPIAYDDADIHTLRTVAGVTKFTSFSNGDATVVGTLNCATLNPTTALAVNKGGTGSTTAANARISLGAAALGSNGDITALTALTTAITLAQGGTGATTAAGARTNLGVQQAMTVTTNANGTAFGFTIGSTTYYLQCMPVGALGVNGSTTLTYPVALTTSVLVALADKYVSGPINDGLNLGAGAPGLTSMTVVNGGTAMSGGYALVIGY